MPRAQNGPSGSPRGRGTKAAWTPSGEASRLLAFQALAEPSLLCLRRPLPPLQGLPGQRLLPRDRESARVVACMCVPVGSWASQRMPGYFPAPCPGVGFRTLSSCRRKLPGSPGRSSDSGSLAVRHGKVKVKIWLLTVGWRADGGPRGSLRRRPLRDTAPSVGDGGSRSGGGLKRK